MTQNLKSLLSGASLAGIIFGLLLSFTNTLSAQKLEYEEQRGDEIFTYSYSFNKVPAGYHILVSRVNNGDTTDKQIMVTGPNFETKSWRYIRMGEATDVFASVTPKGVHITGYLDGDKLDKLEKLDEDELWIQLFPMNPGMDKFIFSEEEEIVFYSIGTESPADMELHSFSAEKEETGYSEEFGCKTVRVNFSPTGWKSYFWDGDYYFRSEDARIVGYRGDGAPGKPSSKTTLIREE